MFSREEIIDILKDDSRNEWLFDYANKIRKEYVGEEVHLRGLIEFSNICKSHCEYCGIRSENKHAERYRISPEKIIKLAQCGVDLGFRTIVLQSGEDAFFTKDVMCEIIRNIKKLDVALTLSVGEKSYEEYKAYHDAGADRYLLRIETTDKNLYTKRHPHMSFENRVRCIKDIKKAGFEVGSGCLVGLPGQTIESLADDILFFKEINADMIGIGPFLPHPETPLKDYPHGSFTLALKVMALTRILLKNINIPATTAMETLHPEGHIIALQSGANVVMPNITTTEYRPKYEIYPNKICTHENALQSKKHIEDKVKSIGRIVSTGYGFRCKTKPEI